MRRGRRNRPRPNSSEIWGRCFLGFLLPLFDMDEIGGPYQASFAHSQCFQHLHTYCDVTA